MALALMNPQIDDESVSVENVAVKGELAQAVRRMIGYCQRGQLDATFVAKGLVIDTLQDIGQQMQAFFPSHTGVVHMVHEIEDKAKEVAQSSGQRYQHISFLYVDSPSKLPKPDDAGKQHSITVYGENLSNVGSDASVMAAAYRPPAGAGAAGGGANLLDHLRVANKIVFVLMFTVLDSEDIRILELLSQPEVAAAFEGAPEALAALKEAMLAGGEKGALAESVVQNIVDLHSLQLAAIKAPTPAQAISIDTAIAHKIEVMMADMPVITAMLPAVVAQVIVNRLDNAKVEITARQSARIVQTLDAGFKSGALKGDVAPLSQLSAALQAITSLAAKAGTSVAAVVAATLTGAASVSQASAVRELGQAIARPAALPAIEQAFPELRAALIEPAIQQASVTRIEPQVIAEQLQSLVSSTQHPAIQEIATRLDAVTAMPAVLQPMQMQAISDNLQALSQSSSLPQEVKADLTVISLQAQVLAVQMRTPDLGVAANQVLPPVVSQAVETLQVLARSSENSTLNAALNAIQKASPDKRAEVMDSVIQNLDAMTKMKGISPELKSEIAKMMPSIINAHAALSGRGPVAVSERSVLGGLTGDKKLQVAPANDPRKMSVIDRMRDQLKRNQERKAASPCGKETPCGDCFNKSACGVFSLNKVFDKLKKEMRNQFNPN